MMSLLHALPAEAAQSLALRALSWGWVPRVTHDARLAVNFLGKIVPSPIGLAAGADKNAVAIKGMRRLGFAFLELGSVTARAQKGNRKPRIFRLPEDKALINRVGFANRGAFYVAQKIKRARARWHKNNQSPVMMGVNIGANSTTLARGQKHEVIEDYKTALSYVLPYVDWITLNISCPNVPDRGGLLAREDFIADLITMARRAGCGGGRGIPLLAKLSPDSTDAQLRAVARAAHGMGVDGFIVTNSARNSVRGRASFILSGYHRDEMGGVTGAPLAERAMECLHVLRGALPPSVPLVSCGGIFSGKDILARLVAGAAVVQLYTSLVYEGAGFIGRLQKEMMYYIRQAGCDDLRSYLELQQNATKTKKGGR